MLAQTRQVHHEGVFELAHHVALGLFEVRQVGVLAALAEFTAEDLFPVRPPFDLFHALAGDQGTRTRGGRGLGFLGRLQVVVIEGEGLVVVVDLRHVGVAEDLHQQRPLATLLGLDRTVCIANPAAVPAVLVFPVFGVADAGLGLNVVEPGVFHAGAAGPDVLAGHRTGVATDALVQVQHHGDLGSDFHFESLFLSTTHAASGRVFIQWASKIRLCRSDGAVPLGGSGAAAQGGSGHACTVSVPCPSCHSILRILRTMTNSSRLVPMVP